MCGIAGSYQAGKTEEIQAMVRHLRHRGPDGSGISQARATVLGHTRLAIIDVANGQQPMKFKRCSISYNGEIYNHQELRSHYLAGEPFRTHTDTETILRLYARFGPSSVEMLDGMFAIAIADGDSLFLARDPLGIKPLYTGARGDALYFASEIKALAGIAEDIREFPAGHWFHSQIGMHRYYQLDGRARPANDFAEPAQAAPVLREVLHAAVQKRLMSDVPLGVSLSGGLDSSIISLLARELLDRLDSFAVGMEGSADLTAAREVADYLGTRHHEYQYTEQDMLAALPDVLYQLESFYPALVRSAIPNYFLARLASQHVKVILGGEGADELYAGYVYLGAIRDADALQTELVTITGQLHNTNLQRADRMTMAFGLEMRVPFLDVASVGFALGLPCGWKLHLPARREKALLRDAFAGALPQHIIDRPKEKFSKGAGSSETISRIADDCVSDSDFATERARLSAEWGYRLPGKEALYYYRILHQAYDDKWIMPTMGYSRSI